MVERPSPPIVASYGTWSSPITTDLVISAAVSLGEVWVDGSAGDPTIGEPRTEVGQAELWWAELRPTEGGQVQVVRRGPDGTTIDLLPTGTSARTRVHEYGGGAWWVHDRILFYACWDDQRLYRLEPDGSPALALTRPPAVPHGLRYADGRVTPDGSWIVCVRESHEGGGEAVNELVAIPATGGESWPLGTHADFVSNPRISPDGHLLTWVQWDHPRMPWDGTELWVASVVRDGDGLELVDSRRVAGGSTEAIVQPEWSPSGVLHFISDRSGWWNLHAFSTPGTPEASDGGAPLHRLDADVGTPPWVFGMRRYSFLADGRIALACAADGIDHLRLLDPATGTEQVVETGYTSLGQIHAVGSGIVGVGASFTTEPVVFALDLGSRSADIVASADEQGLSTPVVLRPARDLGLDPDWLSVARPISFPTAGGGTAHALHYPPTNPEHEAPAGECPPLLVAIHGGPTSAARPQLQLGIQYWTSRGFAVADVNYRGSTGFGRTYRQLLNGQWGIADVEDCRAVAEFLATRGAVDPRRQAIHGGSAGGFTTLCALVGDSPFDAGTSSYGVTDLTALAADTHKFESRYLDSLVGPYPERRDLYRARSPIHHGEELRRPVLILQGLEDEIVPPAQAEILVEALRRNGVPFAYLAFEGEQHGFRQAPTIRRALEAELFFYAAVFGFGVPADVEPLEIENLGPDRTDPR
jgi:dipeptidyl aminopeptidase/acylaminoacyl peptidase